jgi:hypothetical protein
MYVIYNIKINKKEWHHDTKPFNIFAPRPVCVIMYLCGGMYRTAGLEWPQLSLKPDILPISSEI